MTMDIAKNVMKDFTSTKLSTNAFSCLQIAQRQTFTEIAPLVQRDSSSTKWETVWCCQETVLELLTTMSAGPVIMASTLILKSNVVLYLKVVY